MVATFLRTHVFVIFVPLSLPPPFVSSILAPSRQQTPRSFPALSALVGCQIEIDDADDVDLGTIESGTEAVVSRLLTNTSRTEVAVRIRMLGAAAGPRGVADARFWSVSHETVTLPPGEAVPVVFTYRCA